MQRQAWRVLYSNAPGSLPQLWLRGTLANGQCFGFSSMATDEGEVWSGVLGYRVIKLRQKPFGVLDSVIPPVFLHVADSENEQSMRDQLDNFFRARVDVDALYTQWSLSCSRFAQISPCFRGIRLLDQEPWECLVSFIASSNNHIPRITKMLHSLRIKYGAPLENCLHAFPSAADLCAKASLDDLLSIGFGYRAKYVIETATLLVDDDRFGEHFLASLRDSSFTSEHVSKALQEFQGVGPKVADCVALFSCNRLDVVPVDIHVFEIAKRDYDDDNRISKFTSVTKPAYALIVQAFRKRFGEYAGWAHSVLFTCELPAFRERLNKDTLQRVITFQDLVFQERKTKRTERAKKKISLPKPAAQPQPTMTTQISAHHETIDVKRTKRTKRST